MMRDQQCKIGGCSKHVQARRMCNAHYRKWLTSMRAQGYDPTRLNTIKSLLKAVLPGTCMQATERIGAWHENVFKTMKAMRDDGLLHIIDYLPPPSNGGHWSAVYAYGPGVDAVLTDERRKAYSRERAREAKRRFENRQRNKAIASSGPSFAALLAPLGV